MSGFVELALLGWLLNRVLCPPQERRPMVCDCPDHDEEAPTVRWRFDTGSALCDLCHANCLDTMDEGGQPRPDAPAECRCRRLQSKS